MRTKQNDHPGMHCGNDLLSYVLKKSIGDRNHRIYLNSCNIYHLEKGDTAASIHEYPLKSTI